MDAAAWIATLGIACWCAATMLRVERRDRTLTRRSRFVLPVTYRAGVPVPVRRRGLHRPARKLQPVTR